MSNVLQLEQSQVGVGLPTYTYTVPAASTAYPFGGAGVYNVKVQVTVPNGLIDSGAGSGVAYVAPVLSSSGVSYVVNQNGTPVFTSATLGAYQTEAESKTMLQCAVADVITVVFSSSNAIDNLLNSVKSIVSIGMGQ